MRTRRMLLAALLAGNALLFLSWFWLPFAPQLGLSPGRFVLSATESQEWLMNTVRRQEHILFLGTSESQNSYNLGYQLNYLTPNDPQVVVVAQAGTSPIHSSIAFARSITAAPLILVVNLVYFTRSHDVINDGWLGNVLPSPVFYMMNHDGIRAHVSNAVRKAYDRHFMLRWLMLPFMVQEYLGNLLFLQVRAPIESSKLKPYAHVRERQFSQVIPRYDEKQNVWIDYRASDEAQPLRWEVSGVDESVNLKGLASTLAVLRRQNVPVLVLILPVNRAFYRYHGLDMMQFERRYRLIRDEIRVLVAGDSMFVLDLYDNPPLHLGFQDRMHADEYGNFQMARYIIGTKPYLAFIDRVRSYYKRMASAPHRDEEPVTPSASPKAAPATDPSAKKWPLVSR
jgi:hypothetical protein